MIFRMEQQWVLLPLLVCQNGNCPTESSGAAVNELNDSSERERGGGKELDGWSDNESAEVWPTSALSKTAGGRGREDHGTG